MSGTTRERLREAILGAGQAARSEEETISLALRLSTRFPATGLTLDTIIEEIKAVSSGAFAGSAPGR
jgi:hypothetical protein